MQIPMKLANSEEMLKFKTNFVFPQVNVGGEKDHSKLENLDYEHSGHTGFASSEDIPTKVSDLENDKGYIDSNVSNLVNYELKSKTGTNLNVSIDSTTYVMTVELKNTAGDVLSSGSVDLPLESMVVGASYDDSTKEIVLTLQSGEEVRFSVADLVSGLVSQSEFDEKMTQIGQTLERKFNMPYYYEYNGDQDFEDTSEETLELFNDIRELMEGGYNPTIIVKKGATGANSYQTYHFIMPQFGSLNTTYIMLKGSPVRVDGSTFNLVALNCERDEETGQIIRVYEKKADGSITIASEPHYVWNGSTGSEAIELFQKVYDAWINENKILNVDYYRGNTKLKLIGIGNPRQLTNQMLCEFISLDPPYSESNSVPLEMVAARVEYNTTTGLVTSVRLEQHLSDYKLIREYNGSYGALPINNTSTYTPTSDYHPSTKLYTDQRVQSIAPDYDATSTYALGDYVSYQGKFYKCTTAIETAEAWNSEHWSETNVVNEYKGSGGGDSVFKVNLTANQTAGYDADKTIDEIQEAITANKVVIAVVGSDEYPLKYHTETELRFTNVELNRSVLILYSEGVWTMQDTNMLKTSGGDVNGNINMNSNAITNIQKLHVDGEAPVYIGSTIETGVTNASRITGIAGGGVAIVRANTQSTYDPLFIADPTNVSHAATKKYVDDAVSGNSTAHYTWAKTTDSDAISMFQEVYNAYKNGEILNVDLKDGVKRYKLMSICQPNNMASEYWCQFRTVDWYTNNVDMIFLQTVNAVLNVSGDIVQSIDIKESINEFGLIREYNGTKGALPVDNTKEFVPQNDYEPATKRYVDLTHYQRISGYSTNKTQVLKNINGTLTWQDE